MSQEDPYVYPGTDILKNKFGLQDQKALTDREVIISAKAIAQLHKDPVKGRFDFDHLCEIHHRIFQDVYDFAGKPRSIDLWKNEIVLKGGSANYAAPDDIKANADAALKSLNGTKWTDLTDNAQSNKFAVDIAKVWLAHPFREGNTRAVLTFMDQFTREKGLDLDFSVLSRMPSDTRDAFVLAAHGMPANLAPLIRESRQAFIDRNHPVLGRVTSETNEVLNLMGKPPITIGKVGDQISGKVLTTSYQTVLLHNSRGITAVDLSNFDTPPQTDKRATVDIRFAPLDKSSEKATGNIFAQIAEKAPPTSLNQGGATLGDILNAARETVSDPGPTKPKGYDASRRGPDFGL
ncbi:Fic/DOC family protein [Microvirga tunisiensis]|uniref:protein adenylyltransferase n=1 Tax=Microvirga tunisiensis TaxID=2108360 RepID=A0A5N7N184_9HYPH|nr:Fic family protein [Microvirga tunisiensis]MPR09240.1 hypothetical protein [Microvirga tunisiensis]MPR29706.1 hypothetical protein [Microvirga tunisiensis]